MKRKHVLTVFLMFTMVFFMGLFRVNAAEVTTDLESSDVVYNWDGTNSWVDEGAKITLPGGVADAWNRRANVLDNEEYGPLYNLDVQDDISMLFSIGLYDSSDGSVISKSNNSTALDIYLMDAENDTEIMLLRIWTDSGGWNNGNHSYEIYPIFGDWGTVIYGSTWIAGDATIDSGFFVQFSKDRLFESYVGGSSDITRLDNGNNDLLNYTYRLDDVEQVYFRIAGDNGFTADTDVIIRSVNGQSLANTSGTFNDDVSPMVIEGDINASITMDEPYTIPITGYDLLSLPVDYHIENASDQTIGTANTFTPDTEGDVTVTLVATDQAGNETEKDYTFDVVNEIDPPVLSDVPTLNDMNLSFYDIVHFESPIVTEETGTYTLTLDVYASDDMETPLYTLEEGDDGFDFLIQPSFEAGEYGLVYKAENEAGITESTTQTITISLTDYDVADFVHQVDVEDLSNPVGMADIVDDGLRMRTTDFTIFDFGTFDMNRGFDIKFKIDPSTADLSNDALGGYVEIVLMNPDNPEMHLMFRVWLGISGPDNPTNVYIKYPEQNYVDLTDAGWISKSVDGVDMQFHMAFDSENGFIGERTSGMVNAEVGQSEIAAFLDDLGSSDLTAGIRAYSLGDKNYFEYIVTEINGQSFASTDGSFDTVEDITLNISDEIASEALIDEAMMFDVYVQDILARDESYEVEVTLPDDSTETQIEQTGPFTYTPSTLGTYTFVFSATGTNGNEVVLDPVTVNVKDKITDPTITLDENYESNYDQNQTITILTPTYSSDVTEASKEITVMLPSGDTVTVSAGDDFTFESPGLYTITYHAADAAEPEANEVSVEFSINVPDMQDPIIAVDGMPEEADVDESITLPDIVVEDDSEYDMEINVTDPEGEDGSRALVIEEGSYVFTPDLEGQWEIEIVATDLYDNQATTSFTIEASSGLSTGGIIGIIAGSLAVIAGGIAAVVLFKR